MVLLGILYTIPYCEACRSYLRMRRLFALPMAGKRPFMRTKAVDAADAQIVERTSADLADLTAAIDHDDRATLKTLIASFAPRVVAERKRPAWVSVSRYRCPHCGDGFIDYISRKENGTQRLQHIPVRAALMECIESAAGELTEAGVLAAALSSDDDRPLIEGGRGNDQR